MKNFRTLLLFSIILFVFVSFIHPDLIHTTVMSTYWNQNLYSVCNGCNYLPLIYFIFYLWSMPFQIINPVSISDPQLFIIGLETNPTFFIYNKVLVAIIFFISIYLADKIYHLLDNNKHQSENKKLVFKLLLFSPFSFFIIFLFGGYDVFALFFILLGIYLFLRKHYYLSFIIFSISLSFKFFSIVIIISFIAFIRESILKKIIFSVIALSIPILQIAFFYNDPIFLKGISQLVVNRSKNSNLFFNPSMIVALFFLIWILFLNYSNNFKKLFSDRDFIYIPYIALLFLFSFSPISPQWIILIIPFILVTIILNQTKNTNIHSFIFIEGIFYLIFLILITNIWYRNIDLLMGNFGLFEFFQNPNFLYKDIYVDFNNNVYLNYFFFAALYGFFFIPLVIKIFNLKINFKHLVLFKINDLIFYRFIFLSLFTLTPFLLSALQVFPNDKFNQELNSTRSQLYSNGMNEIYLLTGASKICELLISPYDNLSFISLRSATFMEDSFSKSSFSLILGDNERQIYDIRSDGKYFYLKLPEPINKSKEIHLCIKNESKLNIKLMTNQNDKFFINKHGYKTFNDKSLALSLFFIKP